ncbi:PTS sugar transporter subunit IIA [Lactiplantibacillus modestisalitolerans]|uniref:PTS sugar transporter subunit IIA n=1 Tax=Lactiplantibacillus modestisalitolerans TaxID=1457219 RepID=A0ABV5WUL5_9LACO|nr:hypothetical protein [Lactiplantibacillus modestisalitolerans]
MRDLLLVSHGPLAQSYLASLDMIAGGHNRVQAVTFDGEISKDELARNVQASVNPDHETVIVVDLPGGTPCNVCLENYLRDDQVTILASLNLPMLLEIYLNLDNPDYQLATALQTAAGNCFDVKQRLAATDDEDDE